MAYWLVKSEPSTYSWEQLVKDKRTPWNGVRNHQAAANLRAMKNGDLAFFYHSGDDKAIVGIARVVKEYYPDPTDETGKFGMVDVASVKPMTAPVTLAAVKAEAKLKDIALVRNSRLSVQPVSDAHWALLLRLGRTTA
jgi:predicted RNA-binding protein with PUA-like domain